MFFMKTWNREDFAAASEYIFEQTPWTTASERKCAADIFLYVAASRNISMFFMEREAASKKILRTNCF